MKQTSQTVFFGSLFDLFTHSSFVRSGVLTSLNLVHFYTWLIEWGVWSEDFMPCKGPRFTPQFDLFFLGEHLFHLLANKMQEFSVFLHTLALWFSTVHWTSYLKPLRWFSHHFRNYCTKKKIEKTCFQLVTCWPVASAGIESGEFGGRNTKFVFRLFFVFRRLHEM